MSSLQPPTYLAKLNPHPRDQFINFQEEGHIYTIYKPTLPADNANNPDNLEVDDRKYTSVTTLIHSLFPPFETDKIIEKMISSSRWKQNKYYALTEGAGMTREDTINEIKRLWEVNRDEAAKAGTAMHYEIECFYNSLSLFEKNRTKNIEEEERCALPRQCEFQYFLRFNDFFTEHFPQMKPYRTEWMVFDEELLLAGSVDMTYRNEETGELWIYDWKRCRDIKKANPFQSAIVDCISYLPDTNFWHYTLQLNIYKYILETKYGMSVSQLFLVVLHPENKNHSFQRIQVPILKKEMADLIEWRRQQIQT